MSSSRCSGRSWAARPGQLNELKMIKKGAAMIGLLSPLDHAAEVRAYAKAGVAALAMELVPRITRAQTMDVLSSQANLAGYKAALDAAAEFGRAHADDDDRGRHDQGGAGAGDGGGCRRLAGDRHRAPAWCGGFGDRCARRRQGAGREPRRQLSDGRRRGNEKRRDRRRLCPRDGRGFPAPPARDGDGGAAAHRHRHLHRADPRPQGAGAAHRRDAGGNGAGFGSRRYRGRVRAAMSRAASPRRR